MASDSVLDGLVPDERAPQILSVLYLLFGGLWAVLLYLDRSPVALADLSLQDWLFFVAAGGAFAFGVLGLASPDRYGVDEPGGWQFALMAVAVVLVSVSVVVQLV